MSVSSRINVDIFKVVFEGNEIYVDSYNYTEALSHNQHIINIITKAKQYRTISVQCPL